jgi:hydroxyacylglutathione hydrolase
MIKKRFQLGEYELLVFQVLAHSYQTFNYLLCRRGQAVLVDCGEAKPVLKILDREDLQLVDVLITHTHNDHVGGCRKLQDQLGIQSTSPGIESFEKEILGTMCCSISTPGHLAVHKCYYFPQLKAIFTGDTIINGAVGRMMGGTPEQYYESLQKLCGLPEETRVFGGHDYLVDNMNFARTVDPGNEAVNARLALYASNQYEALFALLGEEKRSNPFLRVDSAEEFAQIRAKKDRF